ncbi:MAG: hypothetical protein HYY04_19150 [Chloroflexi bacterium]|nr:hypothetical protein [Chloroflexota bacterium]
MPSNAPLLPLIAPGPAEVAAALQHLLGGPTGYRLRRLFLVQYWRWDYEVIEIPHGRLFLTGRNASGKSTALAAAMVLLDGSLRPERLDTSGKRARQIADYVLLRLDEDDVRYRWPQRHSYLAAEFECLDAELLAASSRSDGQPRPETITLGMAFLGRWQGHTPVETTYFVLADGSRLERDIPLLTVGGSVYEPRAFFRQHFHGHPGRFWTRGLGEYQQFVAEHLFGYEDRADLEQLTEWLTHLRRPDIVQATASLAALSDRLKTALPPLDESVARKLVEAFEQLAELRRDRARSYEQLEACEAIEAKSRALAEALVRQRAWAAAKAADDERKRQRNLRDHQREAEKLQEQIATAQGQLAELAGAREQCVGRIQAIESSALLRDHAARLKELGRLGDDLDQADRDVDDQRRQVETSRASLEQSHRQIEQAAMDWREQFAQGQRHFVELAGALRQARGEVTTLDALSTQLADDRLEAEKPPVELAELERLAGLVQGWLAHAEQVERSVDAWRRAKDQAERLGDQVRSQWDAVDAAEKRREVAERELERAWERLGQILDDLAGDPLARDLVAALRAAATEGDVETYRRASAAAAAEIERRHEALESDAAQLDQAIGGASRQLAEVRDRREALEAASDLAPERSPERLRARRVLADLGIAARPLYEMLDLRPDLPDDVGGQVERMLLDTGLLDALVVRPEDTDRAMVALVVEGLRDSALDWAALHAASGVGDQVSGAGSQAPGARFRVSGAGVPSGGEIPETRHPTPDIRTALVVDAALGEDAVWRPVAEQLLAHLPFTADGLLAWQPDGRWRHGVLAGATGPGGRLGFLGATQRRARRLAEIEARRGQEAALAAEIKQHRAARERQRASQAALRAARGRVQGSVAEARLELAQQQLADRERELTEVRQQLSTLIERKRQLDEEVHAARGRLEQVAIALDLTADRAADGQSLPRLQQALRAAEHSLALLRQVRETLRATWRRHRDLDGRLADDLARLSDQEQLLRRAQERQARLGAAIQQLRDQLGGAEYQSCLTELERLHLELRTAEERIRDVERASERDHGRLEAERARIAEYQAEVDEARQRREKAEAAFGDHLLRYRTPAIEAAREQAAAGLIDAAVQQLVPAVENFLEEGLAAAITAARKAFGDAYHEHRPLLKSVAPVPDLDDGRIIVQTTRYGACSLAEYIGYLGEEIALQESLIQEQHEHFYKEVLMRHAAREIREAIARADEWLARTSDLLRDLPFAQQRYSFALKPNPQSNAALARVFDAFRKSEATFTDRDADRLRQALAEEAERLRRDFERGDRAEFTRQLDELFDYRSWILVEIRVDGRPLTERAAQTASGGEQAFDFAVPLVVALAALYDNARAFAPRLIAFDEAFMKASSDNKSQMLRLLQHLGFQWLIASPDLPSNSFGRAVPAYAEYHLEYTRGEERAEMTPLLALIDGGNIGAGSAVTVR